MKKKWSKTVAVIAIAAMSSSVIPQGVHMSQAATKAVTKQVGASETLDDSAFQNDAFSYGAIAGTKAKAVERKATTGKEWTGEGNNLDITSVNTLPDSSNLIPYADMKSAYLGARDYAREDSKYYQLLTGKGEKWDLTVFDCPADAQNAGEFQKVNYQKKEADGWKSVELPASWTSFGFDYPIYTNSAMPFEDSKDFPLAPVTKNPVGLYRKTFKVNKDMLQDNGKVYLTFAGVESAYYVYVNGQEVGYSEDSYDHHSFDITDLLNPVGQDNTLAVKVLKFCDGTWIEDQDMIYDGGIFRDVYLSSAPVTHIKDYTLKTDLSEDFSKATVNVELQTLNDGEAAKADMAALVTLYDANGKVVISKSEAIDEVTSGDTVATDISFNVDNPKLWDSEHPNLYTAVVTLYDANAKLHYESVSQNIGFRKLSFTSTQVTKDGKYNNATDYYETVKLNGKRLMIKGVNRHDTDIETGKYISKAVYEKDIEIMKQNNINAIRTSHYPNDDYLYYLCDKYGLYVMSESNNECHALYNNSDTAKNVARLEVASTTRQSANYERFKNTTCNLFWSIGNECCPGWEYRDGDFAGGTFARLVQYFKDRDDSRMVHYEGMSGGEKGSTAIDMVSHMYYSPDSAITSYGDNKSHMPFILCEYCHAMGNAVGSLKEYWDIIRSYDNLMGGFIWDFVDQSRKVAIKEGDYDYYDSKTAKTSGMYDLKGYFLGYGGDWSQGMSGDKNFCMNGLVSADRNPQPEMKEVKYQYQNFWFTSKEEKLAGTEIDVTNESISTNLSEYDVTWDLMEDGKSIASGKISEDVLPKETKTIQVPYALPAQIKDGAEYFLNISVKAKEQSFGIEPGYEVAYAQFPIDVKAKSVPRAIAGDKVSVVKQSDYYIVKGDDFSFRINCTNGLMESYYYKDKLMMRQGPKPNISRARLDNDKIAYMELDKYLSLPEPPKVSKRADGCYMITTHIESSYRPNSKLDNAPGIIELRYIVENDGSVTVKYDFDFTMNKVDQFTKVGTNLVLSQGLEDITWYGKGDGESYNDRSSFTRVGTYKSTVTDMFYPFSMPQDCGNLTGVRWMSLADKENKVGMLFCANNNDLTMSALHFTLQDLNSKAHVNKLKPKKKAYVNIDAAVRGTGNESCGFATLEQYRAANKKAYSMTFTMVPYNTDEDEMEISKKYRSQDYDFSAANFKETTVETIAGTPAADPRDEDDPEEEKPVVNPTPTPVKPTPTPGAPTPAPKAKVEQVTGVKATAAKKSLKVSWKAQTGVTYAVAYSTSKSKLAKMKNAVVKATSGTKVIKVSTNKKTIKKLKKKKKYYLKVCAISKDGKTIGNWSKVVTKKTK